MIRLFVICFGCCFSSKKKENVNLPSPQHLSTQIENFGVDYVRNNPDGTGREVRQEIISSRYPIIRVIEASDDQGNVGVTASSSIGEPGEDVLPDSTTIVVITEGGRNDSQGDVSLAAPPSISESVEVIQADLFPIIIATEGISHDDRGNIALSAPSHFNETEEIQPQQSAVLIKSHPLSESEKELATIFEIDLNRENVGLEPSSSLKEGGLPLPVVLNNSEKRLSTSILFSGVGGNFGGPIIKRIKSISPTFGKKLKTKRDLASPSKLRDQTSVQSVPIQSLKKSQSFDQNTLSKLKKQKKGFPKGVPPKLPTHRSVQELFRGSGLSANQLLEGVASCNHFPGRVIEIDLLGGTCLRRELNGNTNRLSIESLECCVYNLSEL